MMGPITLLQSLEGHKERVWCVAWSPSGRVLATCGADKVVRFWQAYADGKWACSAVLEDLHQRTVRRVAWSPCEKYLATAGFDATVGVWQRTGDEWECMSALEGHENEVKSVAWSSSGTLLATCGRDKSVWIWEMQPDGDFECASVLQGHSQDVKALAWHPEEERLVSCSYDDTLKVWAPDVDGDDWHCAQTISRETVGEAAHTSTVWDLAFDPEGRRLASCSDDLSVRLWHCERGKDIKPAGAVDMGGGHERTIYSVSWSPDGKCLATGAGDNMLRVFREQEAGSWGMLGAADHGADVNCVAWNPKQPGIVATAADDWTVRLWRVGSEGADK